MGFSHYWRTVPVLDTKRFKALREDFERCLPLLSEFCPLAGGSGKGAPTISDDVIAFNGADDCGHPKNSSIVIPWPEADARGVEFNSKESGVQSGHWFAGAMLSRRTCDGSCSYETFRLERVMQVEDWWEPDSYGRHFNCCKTAFRPYDLAVTTCLVLLCLHFPEWAEVRVTTDGTSENWQDASWIIKQALGRDVLVRVDVNSGIEALEVVSGQWPVDSGQ